MARDYFIACEEKFRELLSKPGCRKLPHEMSQEELIQETPLARIGKRESATKSRPLLAEIGERSSRLARADRPRLSRLAGLFIKAGLGQQPLFPPGFSLGLEALEPL